MKQVDRTIAPDVTEYGRLVFPCPESTVVDTHSGGRVEVLSLDRCPEPVCRITVAWPVGLMDCGNMPVASLVSAALREGTSHRSASEISSLLESNGAWLASETLQEYTLLHLYALNRRLSPVLDVLHDIISDPVFPAERVDALRQRQADSALQNRCKVSYMADVALRPLMTGKKHLRSRIASPEEILAVDDIELKRYWRDVCAACAPTIWIAGNVSEEVMRCVSSFAASLPVAREARSVVTGKETYRPEPRTEIVTEVRDAKQAAVVMGMPVPGAAHADHMMLRTAVSALGGYFGSRLNANIRENKGLTYGIGASLRMSSQGTYLYIQAQADEAFVGQVVEETAREMRGLWENPVSADEQIAIRRNQQSRLAGMLDSPFATLDYCLAMQQTGVDTGFFDRSQDALAFTADDIARVAENYLNPDNLSVSIARKL